MSFRSGISGAAGTAAAFSIGRMPREIRARTCFLPVLHVEHLDEDAHLDAVIAYARGYRELTGRRILATCMTPLSPLVKARLDRTGVNPQDYTARMRLVAEHADIGLHGHFLRSTDTHDERPFHASFFDLTPIRAQIAAERDFLLAEGLMQRDQMSYSAGWWFMVPALRAVLPELGFRYDFSLSTSPENFSYSTLRADMRSGRVIAEDHGAHRLFSAVALSSTGKRGRMPYYVPLVKIGALSWRQPADRFITLYSHDYDLRLADSLAGIRDLKRRGFGFFEPAELVAAWEAAADGATPADAAQMPHRGAAYPTIGAR